MLSAALRSRKASDPRRMCDIPRRPEHSLARWFDAGERLLVRNSQPSEGDNVMPENVE
jgi:hypothetical protein